MVSIFLKGMLAIYIIFLEKCLFSFLEEYLFSSFPHFLIIEIVHV